MFALKIRSLIHIKRNVQMCIYSELLFSVSTKPRGCSDMGGVRGSGELEKILLSYKLLSERESI